MIIIFSVLINFFEILDSETKFQRRRGDKSECRLFLVTFSFFTLRPFYNFFLQTFFYLNDFVRRWVKGVRPLLKSQNAVPLANAPHPPPLTTPQILKNVVFDMSCNVSQLKLDWRVLKIFWTICNS